MKKTLGILCLLLIAFTIIGCGSKPAKEQVILGKDGTPRPDWVKIMSKAGTDIHYEVGYGKLSNFATSQKKAESDGRNKIALWIQADVNSVLKTYTQDSGIGDQRELIEFMEEVSMQTAKASISGATIEDNWEDKEGGVYVLMSYDVNKAAVNFENQLKSYQRNESAAFAEFKAQEAFKQFQVQNAEKAADEEAKNLF
ncbi:MAG: hypothetical protein GX220_01170 [Treponema sp.]|nr:hypothetical protein [Treponema sp.]